MKANKYILLLLCLMFLVEVSAQQYDRIRVRYGDHDNFSGSFSGIDISIDPETRAGYGHRDANHFGACQVPAIPGGVNANVQLWGAGGGSGGSQAIGALANASYSGIGGAGGGGYSAGSIGISTVVPTVSSINYRTVSPFTINVGKGGAIGLRELRGSGSQPYDGGAGGSTSVLFVNNIVAGGGSASSGGRTNNFIPGLVQWESEIATGGGRGGSPQNGNGGNRNTSGTGNTNGSGNGGNGGGVCNALCAPFANRISQGGAGGTVVNGGTTNTLGAGTGAGGDARRIQIPIIGNPSPARQLEGLHGTFPGGGASGSATYANGIGDSRNVRGGAGANGLAYLFVDIFAEAAATPQLALVQNGVQVAMSANDKVCTANIDYMLVVTNPQPVEYFWYKDNQLLEGAKDPYLPISETGTYKVGARSYTGTYTFPKAISLLDGQNGTNSSVVTVSGSRLNYSVTVDASIGTYVENTNAITFTQAPIIDNVTYDFVSGDPSRTITINDLMLANANNVIPSGTLFTWTVLSKDSEISGTTTASTPQTITTGALFNSAFATKQVVYQVTPYNVDCPGAPFNITIRVLPGDSDMNLPRDESLCCNQPFQLGTDRYAVGIWSSSDPSIIKVEGNGIITGLKPGTATITFTVVADNYTVSKLLTAETCDVRVNPHIRATFQYDCVPMTNVTLIPVGIVHKFFNADGSPKTAADASTTFTAIAFSSSGAPASYYEWYVDGVLQGGRTGNNTFTYTTPVPAGVLAVHQIKVYAYDDCTGTDAPASGVESAVSIVDVTKDNLNPSENFQLSGQVCYDVRMTDHRNGSDMACLPLSARVDDFVRGVDLEFGELVATKRTFTYSFVSREGVSYSGLSLLPVLDPQNLLDGAPSLSGNTITITFRKDIHTRVQGQKYTLELRVSYTSGGTVYTLALPIEVQDCGCGCRVRTVGGGWLTFMCYNLGVTDSNLQTMNAEAQAEVGRNANANTRATIQGHYYQWGRHTDGHERRGSATRQGRVNLTTGLEAPVSHANLFITTPGGQTPYAWYNNDNTAAGRSLWDGNQGTGSVRIKTVNDPCPSGWRMPTIAEWQSVLNGNTNDVNIGGGSLTTASGNLWTWRGTGSGNNARGGWLVSPDGGTSYTLYIPAAGYRTGTSSGAPLTEPQTAYYWSSTAINDSNGRSRYINMRAGQLRANMYGGKVDGHSVRCVME